MGYVWAALFLVGFALMAWWAYRTDPHWVAKDGKAFTCRVQKIGGEHMLPDGRWKEGRALIDGRRVIVRPKGLFVSSKPSAHYKLIRRNDTVKGMAVYYVDGGGINGYDFAALRVPRTSRAVPEIDKLLPDEVTPS